MLFWFSLFRTEAAVYQQVLQVDLEMNVLLGLQWSQEVTWQVEYPLTQTVSPEVTTLIQLAQQDLGGIVPLAMVRRFYHKVLCSEGCLKTCQTKVRPKLKDGFYLSVSSIVYWICHFR